MLITKMFGVEKMPIDAISSKLKDLLYPMDPIIVYHRLK